MNEGPWSRHKIAAFPEEAQIRVRLGCNASTGHPVLVSSWFLPLGDKLWCETQQTEHVVSMPTRDPRCAFEVSVETPPCRGVRRPAVASLHDDRGEEILRQSIDRNLRGSKSKLAGLLLAGAEHENAIAIAPKKYISWDYSERMREAI